MGIYSLGNIKEFTQKWEQWEQNSAASTEAGPQRSNSLKKVGTKWEQSGNTHTEVLPEQDEQQIQSYLDFANQCLPGDEWQIPTDWLTETDSLRDAADLEVRKRNPNFRVWRSGKNHLACKIFFGKEPPPYRRPPSSKRFRKSSTNRIQTMWSEEHGWCSWDPESEDYLPDPTLN